MGLETMTPDPEWDPGDHERAVELLRRVGGRLTFRVWGDDGCKDCRRELPGFAAALAAAGVPAENVVEYEVERLGDGSKRGPGVEDYGIERIPTIVVERDGEELTRFVESAPLPPAAFLAERLEDAGVTAA